jgi:uncharacterized protein YeaO (DUF488 family)
MDVRLKRAYEPASAGDGYRVLVDRLWPRGVSRKQAALDEWAKDLAPSSKLREWFGHEPARFAEFRGRYIDELRADRSRLTALRRRARIGTLTLVYSAHDSEHNDAVVLAEVLRRGLPRWGRPVEDRAREVVVPSAPPSTPTAADGVGRADQLSSGRPT